ncbi:MAG TPA: glycosyltransferase [Thermoanaerobaculia bacterium]|jgi:GT2 family glycosyltransferase
MLSLLVVNYRSGALAIDAIRSARAATARKLQVVVVDNSCDPREADSLRVHADVLIVSATNRGYAGAINDGRRACEGDVLIVCNPDVAFTAGSIDALVSAITGDVAVAGPALFWDSAMRWCLPPAERLTAIEKVDEVLASRSSAWFAARDRRRIRRRAAFWSLDATTHVESISGAVMAIRAADSDEFDERFALYFEETDFLRRVAERRRAIVYVPAARCRHIYNQSAGQDSDEAGRRYLESEQRYLAKWNGPFVARLLKSMERPVTLPEPPPSAPMELSRDGLIVEASPMRSFATAAGYLASPGERRVEVPAEVWSAFRGSALYLRVVDPASGEVLTTARALK